MLTQSFLLSPIIMKTSDSDKLPNAAGQEIIIAIAPSLPSYNENNDNDTQGLEDAALNFPSAMTLLKMKSTTAPPIKLEASSISAT